MGAPQHLYLHIPFCQRRCAYCDFNTYANMEDRIEAYVEALCAELGMLHQYDRQSHTSPDLCATIFFGGGTPSMLTLHQVERILDAASAYVPLHHAEVTMEANPGTILGAGTDALAYLQGIRSLGVNRLSLGVQTLHDPTLQILGRTHTATEAYTCYQTARRAGFDNINLDFIFGLPGQTLEQWQATLATMAAWEPEHFSLYSLILEESTPLYAQVMGGRVSVPDDDATAAMYECAMERLAAAGYTQYEISNWTRGRACQHNLAYWLNSDYLAAGAGAHGHVYPQRYANIRPIDTYLAAVQAGRRPVEEIIALTAYDLCAETMFMGLRLNAGVNRAHFRERCGVELASVYADNVHDLHTQGLLDSDNTAIWLTERGRMLGNYVFAQFVS